MWMPPPCRYSCAGSGWLVAVEGPCRGTDYRIHTGYNYIGREAGDICIRGDSTISAQRDANVTYVPQTREFYIAHELAKTYCWSTASR